jgi:hypothetical protein
MPTATVLVVVSAAPCGVHAYTCACLVDSTCRAGRTGIILPDDTQHCSIPLCPCCHYHTRPQASSTARCPATTSRTRLHLCHPTPPATLAASPGVSSSNPVGPLHATAESSCTPVHAVSSQCLQQHAACTRPSCLIYMPSTYLLNADHWSSMSPCPAPLPSLTPLQMPTAL